MVFPSITHTSSDADATSGPAPALRAYDTGLLLVRLAVGLTMAAHGAQKLFGWFGGGGIHGTAQFFTMSGYPAGQAMAVVSGLTETLGGLALALGLLTPLVAAAIAADMVNAIAVKWGGGFFAPKGVEHELLLAMTATALALAGPGRYAVDRFLPVVRSHRLAHGLAALVFGAVVAVVVLLLRK
jgi:putative oxidoreductase